MAARRTNHPVAGGSTTWSYETHSLRRSRREGQQDVAKPPRWGKLSRRNPRQKLTLTITYRGGAECWYLIEARGSHGVVSGALAIHDVMREINNVHGDLR